VKNESWVASEYQFVLDIMQTTLGEHQFMLAIDDPS